MYKEWDQQSLLYHVAILWRYPATGTSSVTLADVWTQMAGIGNMGNEITIVCNISRNLIQLVFRQCI